MPIAIGDKITRKTSNDSYPLMDASTIGENFYVVKTTSERDALKNATLGLKASCLVLDSTPKIYWFSRNALTQNITWQELSIGTQLPEGSVQYKGVIDPSAPIPNISLTVNKIIGHLYAISPAGDGNFNNTGNVSYAVGDFVIYNGSTWEKISGSSTVQTWGTLSGKPSTFPINLKNNGTDTNAGTVDILNIKNGSFASSTNNNIKTVELTLPSTNLSTALTVNQNVGGYKANDVIPKDTPFETIISTLLRPYIPPTYTLPTINSVITPSTTPIEIGTIISSITFTTTYVKNNAGPVRKDLAPLTSGNDFWIEGSIQEPSSSFVSDFKKYDANPSTIATTLTDTWTKTNYSFSKLGTYSFKTEVFYDAAPQLPGDQGGSNQFGAGSISTTKTITTTRRSFWGTSTDNTVLTTSSEIRALTASQLNLAKNSNFTITIAAGTKMVCFAFPASLYSGSEIPVVTDNGLNQTVSANFVKATVNVRDASGLQTSEVAYNLYTYVPDVSFSTSTTYSVKI